jgi:16S rRNA (guanine527-N7)-methyltransferase
MQRVRVGSDEPATAGSSQARHVFHVEHGDRQETAENRTFHVEDDPPAPPHSTSHSAVRPLLAAGLRELELDEGLVQPLCTLAELLAQWASRMNLTGHRTPEGIARRLILDALALGRALPIRAPTSLVDLGSGAGFPGLPLAICWPRTRVTLVEARARRHHFQRAAVRTLGLVNAEPRRGRIEELPAEPHEVAVAQALAGPEQAVAWMRPWVAPGGWLVLARTPESPELAAPEGFETGRSILYQVPCSGPTRALWIARRAVDGPREPVVKRERSPS